MQILQLHIQVLCRALMRIEFDALPGSVNMNSRAHWGVRAAHAKRAFQEVGRAVEGMQIPLEPLCKVRLEFHYFLPTKRRRDLENLRASVKSHVDALCPPTDKRPGLSIIADDSVFVVLEERVSAEYRKGNPGWQIDIIVLDN